MQRCFESLLGPCPLRLLLFKTGLSGDYVTLHDVMGHQQPAVQVPTCAAQVFVVDLLLLFPEQPVP